MVNIYTYLSLFLEDIHSLRSLNEFEKHFKKPHQTIKIHLNMLVNAKILLQDKRERFLFYKLNMDNPLVYEYLAMCEKQRMIDFLKKEIFKLLYDGLSHHFENSKMLIFGSATIDKNYSDIDILVLSKNNSIREFLKKFELTYSVKIHLTQTSKERLTKTFIREIRKKHIILNEHDYFIKILYHQTLS